jgi:hypothetical protein
LNMKTMTWIWLAALAFATSLLGQTDLDLITQLRQIQILPPGATVSAIPVAGEVAPISGKPYSAISRTVEYSPDGKHVDRSDSNHVYRDEFGRTRRETNGGNVISIVDAVAGMAYTLRTETKTAMTRALAPARPLNANLQPANTAPISLRITNQTAKVLFETVAKMGGINVLWDPEITPPARNQFNIDLANVTLEQALNSVAAMTKSYWKPLNSNTIFITDDNPIKRAAAAAMQSEAVPAAPQMSLVEAAKEQARRMSAGGRGGNGNAANITVDDLGTQIVNGVTAQGVRSTSIIPTGTFGNDHDLKTVTERWVSEDLHVLVKSVYTDSRTGSTVYDLLNISLAPPPPSLFQVPNGYTVQEGGGRGGRGGAMPVPTGGR